MPDVKKVPADIICLYEEQLNDPETDPFEATISAIDDLAAYGREGGGLCDRGFPQPYVTHWYTRLAAGLTEYLTRPETDVTLNRLRKLSARKGSLVAIFSASGYGNMQHLVRRMTYDDDGARRLSFRKGALLLAVLGIDDLNPPLLDAALKQPPEVLLELMLGWLTERSVLTERGEQNRTALIKASGSLVAAQISDSHIAQVVHAWMYCTYATTPDKHFLKLALNALLKDRMDRANIVPKAASYRVSTRPKMVVLHERFTGKHAMYRCYAPSIKHLRDKFEVVAFADETNIDHHSDSMFDKTVRLPKKFPTIKELVDLINGESPQVVYYPSLGMSHWTIMLAQLRLAPLQIMTYGHPATPNLDTIDFGYINEVEGDLAQIHKERVVLGPSLFAFEPHNELPQDLRPLVAPSDREVRVAVNSKVMKLSHRLLEICARLERDAKYPVKFSFFPGERFIPNDGLTAAIRAKLPSAEVVPYTTYQNFLDRMCKADLALASFPFGNTNSTVDTCLLGLPTVVHHGPEIPSQTDRLVLETAGLSSDLVCRDDEAFYQTALNLIDNPAERIRTLNGLSRKDIRKNIFGAKPRETDHIFAEVAASLYRHQESLVLSPRRVFNYDEIMGL